MEKNRFNDMSNILQLNNSIGKIYQNLYAMEIDNQMNTKLYRFNYWY